MQRPDATMPSLLYEVLLSFILPLRKVSASMCRVAAHVFSVGGIVKGVPTVV